MSKQYELVLFNNKGLEKIKNFTNENTLNNFVIICVVVC